MKIAVRYPSNISSAWSVSEGIPGALERLGHQITGIEEADLVLYAGAEHMARTIAPAACPVAAWYHESSERNDGGWAGGAFRKLWRKLDEVIDLHFFPAIQDAEIYERLAPGRSFYLPFGVDETVFHPGLNNDRDLEIAFIGTVYNKRSEYLARLLPELPELRLGTVIVSDLDEVHLRDSTERLARNYRRIRTFLNLPSYSQLIVTKVYEAMACGCRVLTPRLRGRAAANGAPFRDVCFYDEDDIEGLVKLARTGNAAEMGQRASEDVLRHHRLTQRLERIIEITLETASCTASVTLPSALR